jgi:hypothetical protein
VEESGGALSPLRAHSTPESESGRSKKKTFSALFKKFTTPEQYYARNANLFRAKNNFE